MGTKKLVTAWNELQSELLAILASGQHLALQTADTSSGRVWSLSIRDDEFPGSGLIIVVDTESLKQLRKEETIPHRNFTIVKNEKLLTKLRSVKGQCVYNGLPVFYYEHLQ